MSDLDTKTIDSVSDSIERASANFASLTLHLYRLARILPLKIRLPNYKIKMFSSQMLERNILRVQGSNLCVEYMFVDNNGKLKGREESHITHKNYKEFNKFLNEVNDFFRNEKIDNDVRLDSVEAFETLMREAHEN